MAMLTRIAITTGAIALATASVFWLAPFAYSGMLEERWPFAICAVLISFFGPGVGSLDIHGGPIWVALGLVFTAPWFLGYAIRSKRWLIVAGGIAWVTSGVLLFSLIA